MEVPRDPVRSGPPDGPTPGSDRLDAALVADLFAEHGPELLRFLLGVLRDRDQAQDALQATFAKAIERGHTAKFESLRGWLYRVAYREAINLKRRGTRQRRLERGFGWLRRSTAATEPEAGDPIVRREAIEAVREALAELSPDSLAVVRARIHEGKTFAQIAEDHHLPLGTVLTRMRRAMERLSRRLRDEIDP